jgi:hypothetical protein
MSTTTKTTINNNFVVGQRCKCKKCKKSKKVNVKPRQNTIVYTSTSTSIASNTSNNTCFARGEDINIVLLNGNAETVCECEDSNNINDILCEAIHNNPVGLHQVKCQSKTNKLLLQSYLVIYKWEWLPSSDGFIQFRLTDADDISISNLQSTDFKCAFSNDENADLDLQSLASDHFTNLGDGEYRIKIVESNNYNRIHGVIQANDLYDRHFQFQNDEVNNPNCCPCETMDSRDLYRCCPCGPPPPI